MEARKSTNKVCPRLHWNKIWGEKRQSAEYEELCENSSVINFKLRSLKRNLLALPTYSTHLYVLYYHSVLLDLESAVHSPL